MLPALDGAIGAMSEPMVSHDCVAFYLLSQEVAKHVKVVQSGQGADEVFARLPLVSADGRARRRVAGRLGGRATATAFFDRDAAGVGTRCSTPAYVGRRRPAAGSSSPSTSPAPARRPASTRAAARHHRDAGRRPGQAGRQHDHGLGPGGPGAVPRPRARRAGRHLPAGAQDRPGRQGRAQRGRAPGDPVRRSSTAQGLLPGACADPSGGPVPRPGPRRAVRAGRQGARPVPARGRRRAARRPQRPS